MADNNPQKVNNALLRRKNNFFVKKIVDREEK